MIIAEESGLIAAFEVLDKDVPMVKPWRVICDYTGEGFIVADTSNTIDVFGVDSNRFCKISKIPKITACSYCEPNGDSLAVALDNKVVEIVKANGKKIKELKGHKWNVRDIRTNFSRNILMTLSSDAIQLWNLTSFELVKSLFSKTSPFTAACFSADGQGLFSAFQDGSVYKWDLSTCTIDDKVEGLNFKAGQLAASPDSRFLVASSSGSPNLIVFSLRHFKDYRVFQLPSGANGVKEIYFLSNNLLACLALDENLYFFDVPNNCKIVYQFKLGSKVIDASHIDPVLKHLVIGTTSGEILLYDFQKFWENGKQINKTKQEMGIPRDVIYAVLKEIDKRELKPETESLKGPDSTTKKANKSKSPPRDKQKGKKDDGFDFDEKELRHILKKFGKFPDKYRPIIWRNLLNLPLNLEAFDNLLRLGIHPAYSDLFRRYPLKSGALYVKAQRILSCLAHHCSLFAEVEYLPSLVFPIILTFGRDELACFEIIYSFLSLWGQHFFEYFPNPPVHLLHFASEMLKSVDSQLWQHFNMIGLSFNDYAWPMFRSLYSNLIIKDDWLSMLDYAITERNNPECYYMILIVYFQHFRGALLKMKDAKDFEAFVEKQTPINAVKLIKGVEDLRKRLDVKEIVARFVFTRESFPLMVGPYAVFTRYQKTAVDKEAKRRQDFQADFAKLEDRKGMLTDLNNLTNEVLRMEQETKEKMEALRKAEESRREQIVLEEEMHMKKVLEEEADIRARRLEHLRNWEKTIQDTVNFHDRNRQSDYDKLEQELAERKRLDAIALRARKEEEVLQNLEFRTSQRLMEMMEFRKREEKTKLLRTAMDYHEKENRMKERLTDERARREDDEIRAKREHVIKEKLATLKNEEAMADQRTLEYRLALEDYDRELRRLEIEAERRVRQMADDAILKQKELNAVVNKQDEILRREEERRIKDDLIIERKKLAERTEQRLARLEEERANQDADLDQYRNQLSKVSELQQKGEFEQRMRELRSNHDVRMSEREEVMHGMMNVIGQEKRIQKELRQEIMKRDRELQDANYSRSSPSKGDGQYASGYSGEQASYGHYQQNEISRQDDPYFQSGDQYDVRQSQARVDGRPRITMSSDSEWPDDRAGLSGDYQGQSRVFQTGDVNMRRNQRSISSYTYSDTVGEDNMIASRQSRDISGMRNPVDEAHALIERERQKREAILSKVSEEDFNSREEESDGHMHHGNSQYGEFTYGPAKSNLRMTGGEYVDGQYEFSP